MISIKHLVAVFALLSFMSPAQAQVPAGCVCPNHLTIVDPTGNAGGGSNCYWAVCSHTITSHTDGTCILNDCSNQTKLDCEFKFHLTWIFGPATGDPCLMSFAVCSLVYSDPSQDPGAICNGTQGINQNYDVTLPCN